MTRKTIDTNRGQAHTVEAFIAALLLISGLLFAMQATAVTPLSASTSNQHIENQQRAVAHDLLSTAAEDGSLKEAVLYWNASSEGFEGSEVGYYTSANSENDFLESLNHTLRERRIAYNVRVRVHRTNRSEPDFDTKRMVYMGDPSDNAVTASRTITVYESDRLTGDNTPTLAASEESFYAENAADSPLYNRVEVRIKTWRM